MESILYTKPTQHTALITLNEPERYNAMSENMAEQFAKHIALVKQDSALRALVITGAGKAFSAGGDLEMLNNKRALSREKNQALMLDFYSSFLSLRSLTIPVIAAINGAAIGAGLCVAAACDIRIAAPHAKLGFTFAKLGLFPGMGSTALLEPLVGKARAVELLVTGRTISAEEAKEFGLVSHVVTGDLLQRAYALVDEIFCCGPQTVAQILSVMRGSDIDLQRALEQEALLQSQSYASAEFAEGISAAREKRSPCF
jgi:enoyl-CoA hydratase